MWVITVNVKNTSHWKQVCTCAAAETSEYVSESNAPPGEGDTPWPPWRLTTRAKQWKKRYFNAFKKNSNSLFEIHICWKLIFWSFHRHLRSLVRESASCSDWTPSLAMTSNPSPAGCGTNIHQHLRFGWNNCASMFMRLASCTPTTTWTVLRKKLFEVMERSFQDLDCRFAQRLIQISWTVPLSRNHHDFHQEVTRLSRFFPTSTTRPLDPRPLAFSDFRLDPDNTILLKHVVAVVIITVTAKFCTLAVLSVVAGIRSETFSDSGSPCTPCWAVAVDVSRDIDHPVLVIRLNSRACARSSNQGVVLSFSVR